MAEVWMPQAIKCVAKCPLCGKDILIEVEATQDQRIEDLGKDRATYTVVVRGKAVDAAVDGHLEKDCAESAGLMGRSQRG